MNEYEVAEQIEKAYLKGKRDAIDELIHCRDCAHYAEGWMPVPLSDGVSNYCSTMDEAMKPDEYCSRAERREDG